MRRPSRPPAWLIRAVLVMVVLVVPAGCGGKQATSGGAASGSASACSYPTAGEAAKPVKPPQTTGVKSAGTAR